MIHDDKKSARLDARISPSVHTLLQRAAALQGRTLSEFVIDSARLAAEATIAGHEVIRLSLQDQQRFSDALLKPTRPGAALKRASARHQKLVNPS